MITDNAFPKFLEGIVALGHVHARPCHSAAQSHTVCGTMIFNVNNVVLNVSSSLSVIIVVSAVGHRKQVENLCEGELVGAIEGDADGEREGELVGLPLGESVGLTDGLVVGRHVSFHKGNPDASLNTNPDAFVLIFLVGWKQQGRDAPSLGGQHSSFSANI